MSESARPGPAAPQAGGAPSANERVSTILQPGSTRPEGEPEAAAAPPKIGRFELLGELGCGAFGTVYRARDPQLGRDVALKVARDHALQERPEALQRFLREARAAAQLHHANIVPVYDAGRDGDVYYIAAALVLGSTLRERCERGAPFTHREAAQLVAAIARALDYAHRQGVVHRDIKPANILLDAAGAPQIADFGLARREQPEDQLRTSEGAHLGTPAYMSPEQAAGRSRDVDGRCDIWSTGVMLYELLTGERPFRGAALPELLRAVVEAEPRPLRALVPSIPRDLETICLKCLEKSPAARYATAGELADDLQSWLDDEPIRARPLGVLERAGRWVRRNRLLAALIVALTAGISCTTYFAWQWRLQLNAATSLAGAVIAQRNTVSEALADRTRAYAELSERVAAEDLRQGIDACQRGQVDQGLLYLGRGFMVAPPSASSVRFSLATNLTAWSRQLSALDWLVELPLPVTQAQGLQFSPDGALIAVAGFRFDDQARAPRSSTQFLDAERGTVARPPLALVGRVIAMRFRPDTRRLLVVEGAGGGKHPYGAIREWDVDRQCDVLNPIPLDAHVQSAAISPDGAHVATVQSAPAEQVGRSRFVLHVWGVPEGRSTTPFFEEALQSHATTFLDNNRVALQWGGRVRIWDVARQAEVPADMRWDETRKLTLVQDGAYAVTRDRLWNVAGLSAETLPPFEESTRQMSQTPPLVLAALEGRLTALRRPSDASVCRLWSHQRPCGWLGQPLPGDFLDFSPTGRTAVTAIGGAVRLWRLPDGSADAAREARLAELAQAEKPSELVAYLEMLTGMSLVSAHGFQLLDGAAWRERRERFERSP